MESQIPLNHSQLSRLKVFIASPSDVDQERKTAFDVINRIIPFRAIIVTFGYSNDQYFNYFDFCQTNDYQHYLKITSFTRKGIIGWEDMSSGVGRPQALINEKLKECKLFIGLLWKRWGSPSGEESSGFHEEYKLALELHGSGQMTNVWLFFKKLPLSFNEDELEQAGEVRKFKREVISSQNVLFKEFDNLEDWHKLLYDNYGAPHI